MPENLLVLMWRKPTIPREAFTSELHETVPQRLAAGGFTLEQMNLADATVAAAAPLRQAALDPQPEALLRIGLDEHDRSELSDHQGPAGPYSATDATNSAASTCARLLDVLADLKTAAHSAAYLVSTREPLADPTDRNSPGRRSPGFSQVALLRHRADLDPEAFRSQWLEQHTAVALATQSTFRYVQHIVIDPLTADAPPLDGIVEECFPAAAMTDPHVFFDTGGADAELSNRLTTMVASVAAFLDLDALDVIPTSEFRFDIP